METALTLLRFTHVGFAILALLTFWIPLVVRKGGGLHRRVGRIYVWCMIGAAITALGITPLRLMERTRDAWPMTVLLAFAGLVALSAATLGTRVLKERSRRGPSASFGQLSLAVLLVVASVSFFAYSVVTHFVLGAVLSPLGALLGLRQWRILRSSPDTASRWWLEAHIGQMLGSCIATLTAAVVNNATRLFGIGAYWVWLVPLASLLPVLILMKRRYAPAPAKVQVQ